MPKSRENITKNAPIERWISLANLLPARLVSPESVEPNDDDEKTELSKLERAWDQQFDPGPKVSSAVVRKILGRNPRAAGLVRRYTKRMKEGELILEVQRPKKRGRGRPPHRTASFSTQETRWRPRNPSELRDLVRSVRSALDAIVEATAPGVREIRAGRKFKWHDLERLDLPAPEFRPLLMFEPDGSGTLLPDPYRQFLQDLACVQPFRIRRCPVCSLLFYSNRKDKGACSPRCLNTNRVRQFRNPNKTHEYEYNRKLKSANLHKKWTGPS